MNETTDAPAPIGDAAFDAALDRLASTGYAVADGWLPPPLVGGLRDRLAFLEAAGELAVAGIGRDGGKRLDKDVRRAAIRWFDGADAAERSFLDLAERIRLAINQDLYLGLFDFECHFIAYPVGGFYGRHLDSLAGAKNRVVSLVAYLDEDWRTEDGGALRLWSGPEDVGQAVETILPRAGRIVLMLSERIPHEVLPASRPRHAIAGWWRVHSSPTRHLDTSR